MAKYDAMIDGIAMPERFAPLVVAKAEPVAASAVPAVALAPGDDSGEGDEDANAGAAAPPPEVAATASPGVDPSKTAPAPGPQKPGGSAVYLSDKELLDAQSATDDGEVEE
jgi:hypothetical protein